MKTVRNILKLTANSSNNPRVALINAKGKDVSYIFPLEVSFNGKG